MVVLVSCRSRLPRKNTDNRALCHPKPQITRSEALGMNEGVSAQSAENIRADRTVDDPKQGPSPYTACGPTSGYPAQPTQPICVTKLFRVEDALSKFEQFQQLVYASLLV